MMPQCILIAEDMKKYSLPDTLTSNFSREMKVDKSAFQNMPEDVPPYTRPLKPASVKADGDCLLHTASVFAFGHENSPTEMRLHTLVEMILHDKLYLDHNHLRQGCGLTDRAARQITNDFCMYSGQYESPKVITRKDMVSTFQAEAKEMSKRFVYMGIWQIFALASVFGVQIFSVYPQKGNPNVRKSVHRLVLPREKKSEGILCLMWTSTRYSDMKRNHFLPNHFVPLMFPNDMTPETLNSRPVEPDEAFLGKHVIVRYEGDNQLYPGEVTDEDDEDVQVNCMHKIGQNRFFWPLRADVCWYSKDSLLTVIPPPERVTERHMQISPKIWQDLRNKYAIEF